MSNPLDNCSLILFRLPADLIELTKTDFSAAEPIINECQQQVVKNYVLSEFKKYYSSRQEVSKEKRTRNKRRFPGDFSENLTLSSGLRSFAPLNGPSFDESADVEKYYDTELTQPSCSGLSTQKAKAKAKRKSPTVIELDSSNESDDEVILPKIKKQGFLISSDESAEELSLADPAENHYCDDELSPVKVNKTSPKKLLNGKGKFSKGRGKNVTKKSCLKNCPSASGARAGDLRTESTNDSSNSDRNYTDDEVIASSPMKTPPKSQYRSDGPFKPGDLSVGRVKQSQQEEILSQNSPQLATPPSATRKSSLTRFSRRIILDSCTQTPKLSMFPIFESSTIACGKSFDIAQSQLTTSKTVTGSINFDQTQVATTGTGALSGSSPVDQMRVEESNCSGSNDPVPNNTQSCSSKEDVLAGKVDAETENVESKNDPPPSKSVPEPTSESLPKAASKSGPPTVISAAKGGKRAADSSSDESELQAPKTRKKRKKKPRHRPATTYYADENADDLDCQPNSEGEDRERTKQNESKNSGQENVRRKKILSAHELARETRAAGRAETDRCKRVQERKAIFDEHVACLEENQQKVVLDFDEKTRKPIVEVHPQLVCHLKEHQIDGIKFMYSAVIESVKQLATSPGSGCALAHSMGLGKTLQVIALVQAIFSSEHTKKHISHVLIICPKNTARNWSSEFKLWLTKKNIHGFDIISFENRTSDADRLQTLEKFDSNGGVLIINDHMFKRLVNSTFNEGASRPGPRSKTRANSKYLEAIEKVLLKKPNLVVIDEGHLIKSERSLLNKAVNEIVTKRRIILTGTPLQNNLAEYYHMVNFIKPHLLGTYREFQNRFENPIKQGQMEDSSQADVKFMKKRVHVLHKLLDQCVHRRTAHVLEAYLETKHEFVVKVQLSNVQIAIYKEYLDKFVSRNQGKLMQEKTLFRDFGAFLLLCCHPYLLRVPQGEGEKNDEEIVDGNSDSSLEAFDVEGNPLPPPSTSATAAEKDLEFSPLVNWKEDDWFEKFISKMHKQECIEIGSKIELFFHILIKCEKNCEKLVVFSQRLPVLSLIESFLQLVEKKPSVLSGLQSGHSSTETGLLNTWQRDIDYFRLDGRMSSQDRARIISSFNNPKNTRARLFLVSTRAGSLGINLVGANRCIVFDSSWNPANDVQALYRIYRFGQTKPTYIYRFVAFGTMESRIYDRQIIKQAMSLRVVDEKSILRHFKEDEIAELYKFQPEPDEREIPHVPKDKVLADILSSEKSSRLIVTWHDHDSLLENRPEEDLPEDERATAWKEYEDEKEKEEAKQRRLEESQQKLQQLTLMKGQVFKVLDEIIGDFKFFTLSIFTRYIGDKLEKKIISLEKELEEAPEAEQAAEIQTKIDLHKTALAGYLEYCNSYWVERPQIHHRPSNIATPIPTVNSQPSTSTQQNQFSTLQSLPQFNLRDLHGPLLRQIQEAVRNPAQQISRLPSNTELNGLSLDQNGNPSTTMNQ